MRVEEERGGRLAKIEELSAHLKRIERVALDNSAYLDENIRVHALWSAIRALSSSALSSPSMYSRIASVVSSVVSPMAMVATLSMNPYGSSPRRFARSSSRRLYILYRRTDRVQP